MRIIIIVVALTGLVIANDHLEYPWVEKFDPITGGWYYLNEETGKRVEKPKEEPKPRPFDDLFNRFWKPWKSGVNAFFG